MRLRDAPSVGGQSPRRWDGQPGGIKCRSLSNLAGVQHRCPGRAARAAMRARAASCQTTDSGASQGQGRCRERDSGRRIRTPSRHCAGATVPRARGPLFGTLGNAIGQRGICPHALRAIAAGRWKGRPRQPDGPAIRGLLSRTSKDLRLRCPRRGRAPGGALTLHGVAGTRRRHDRVRPA